MATTLGRTASGGKRRSPEREELNYRLLRIVAGRAGASFKAIAYAGSKKLLESDGPGLDEAVTALKASIDALHAGRVEAREAGVPAQEAYADALRWIERFVSPLQQSLLFRHLAAPRATISFERLATQAGVGEDDVRKAYARLGRYLTDILGFLPKEPQLGRLHPILALAQPADGREELIEWALLPPFAAALGAQSAGTVLTRS